MTWFHNIHQCRLYDLNSETDLLLDGCSAQVLIADVHASVTLSQRFTSPEYWNNAVSGVYTFGMMADAAVCGFEMIRQDGTLIRGIVKDKLEAKREYDEAISVGKTASFGQQETPDVFSIAVGNILPSETVTINLRYILPLIDDEKKDQIKFIFPRTYAQRYGVAPTFNSGKASTVCQPFQMNVVIQQAGAIKSISCPSGHPISVELGTPDHLTATSASSHYASVSLTDRSGFLVQDVVLVVSADGLDTPRCFIERHPSPNHESAAMALTFVPRFNIPDLSDGMEYIFLVDRSGSMEGTNLQLVQEALIVLLRGLPTVGTTFNIVSFGSHSTKLWENSQEYSQRTLEQATKHVDSMKADYGGTEIASALQVVYNSLPKPLERPAAVFLLTDGSAWDVPTCVEYTLSALNTLPQLGNPNSFIRAFTVGIGNGASSDTCESIARAGGGFAVYVKEGEALVGKCARLVRAARTPEVKVEVEWGVKESDTEDEEDCVIVNEIQSEVQTSVSAATINLFDVNTAPAVENTVTPSPQKSQLHPTGPPPKLNPTLPSPPRIQQSPIVLPTMFPGTRTRIYAITRTPKDSLLPVEIKIKGRVPATDALVELVIPVSTVLADPSSQTSSDGSDAFLHTIAAKALIKDREEGKHAFPPSICALFEPNTTKDANLKGSTFTVTGNSELKTAYLEKDIICLGTVYGLASKYTSFVAVDPRQQVVPRIITPTSSTTLFGAPMGSGFGVGMGMGTLFGTASTSKSLSTIGSGGRLFGGTSAPVGSSFTPTGFGGSLFGASPTSIGPPAKSGGLSFGASSPPAFSSPPPTGLGGLSFGSSSSSAGPTAAGSGGYLFGASVPMNSSPAPTGFGGSLFGAAKVLPVAPGSELFDTPIMPQFHSFDGSGSDYAASGAFSSSSSLSIPGSSPTPTNSLTGSALLAAIARFQHWHGGFQFTLSLLNLLGDALDFSQDDIAKFEERLAEKRIDRDVGATIVALVWMERYGGEEALDMKEKAEMWVRREVGEGREQTLREDVLGMFEVK